MFHIFIHFLIGYVLKSKTTYYIFGLTDDGMLSIYDLTYLLYSITIQMYHSNIIDFKLPKKLNK